MALTGRCSWDGINRRIRECRRRFAEPLARIKCLKEIIDDYGEDGMIYFTMGEEYEAAGNYEEALRCYM